MGSIRLRACVLAGAPALAGCSGPLVAGAPEDPFRVQFLSFCEEHPDQVRIETQSRGRIRTADDCACIFDAAMKDLPEPERQVAAFYLMSQPGAGEAELQQFRDMDLNAMGTACAAMGKALQRCPAS